MTKNKNFKLLLIFLVRQQILLKFIQNLGNPQKFTSDIAFKPRIGLIMSAFIWNATPEGHEYWALVHRNWTVFVREFS